VTYPKTLRATILCYKYSSHFRFDQLTEILAVDFPGKEARFVLFYGFLNINFNNRLWLAALTDEKKPMPSVTSLFPSAL